jgi:hypothetical protein
VLLAKIQPTTYIKIRSTSSEAAGSRHDYEKENFAMKKYQKLVRLELDGISAHTDDGYIALSSTYVDNT